MSLDRAIAWVRSLADTGTGYDHDNKYGYQCVDIINGVLSKYAGVELWGNAIDLPDSAKAKGLTYIADAWGVNPKRGDIFVMKVTGHEYGHTGVVIEDSDGVTIKSVEQNVDGNKDFLQVGGVARYVTRYFETNDYKILGWIRPNYTKEGVDTMSVKNIPTKNVNGDLYSGLITSSRPEIFWSGGQRNTNQIKYIVIHGTATTSQQAVWNTWARGSNRQASAHYVVDKSEIIGCVGENYVAWHSGGVATITNNNSIGVEHMNSSIGNVNDANTYLFADSTIETGAKLVAELCHRYGLVPSASTIVPHRQVSATACPQTLNMTDYINRVKKYYNGSTSTTATTQQSVPVAKSQGNLTLVSTDQNAGTFTVRATGVTSSQEIVGVKFPTWTDTKGQDDIKWYDAKKVSDGVYELTVKISDHNGEHGKYHVHGYTTHKNGIKVAFFKGIEVNFTKQVTSKDEGEVIVFTTDKSKVTTVVVSPEELNNLKKNQRG